ncbi:MAG: Hsp33 family molecular chaperone HslO, partial [Deltaproteobacteria bacterium]
MTDQNTTQHARHDHVVRAITDDGAFRVITAQTTGTVRAALAAQSATGQSAQWLGDLLTATILTRETMSPGQRVQGIVTCAGGVGNGSLVADAQPDGSTRGLVRRPSAGAPLVFGAGTLLQMARTLPNRTTHHGVVEVPVGGGISEGVMAYMQSSEQVVSMMAIATLFDDAGAVAAAGGYLVQVLPEVETGALAIMAERLAAFDPLAEMIRGGAGAPDALIEEILYRMPYTRLEESALRFGCQCSHERVVIT